MENVQARRIVLAVYDAEGNGIFVEDRNGGVAGFEVTELTATSHIDARKLVEDAGYEIADFMQDDHAPSEYFGWDLDPWVVNIIQD